MNQSLAALIERVKEWPADRQEDVIHVLEGMEESGTVTVRLSAEELAAAQAGLDSELLSEDAVAQFRNRQHYRI